MTQPFLIRILDNVTFPQLLTVYLGSPLTILNNFKHSRNTIFTFQNY